MPPAAILDVDGTLVDTNYHHAVAWYRAFRRHGIVLPVWRIHRHIGMGGDQLVKALCDEAVERDRGEDIRSTEKDLYMELIEEVEPLEGAKELIRDLKDSGHAVVLASSAKAEEVDHYLELLDARDLADDWTTSADVEATKPEPDLVRAALDKAGSPDRAVMVGDSVWDCEAAAVFQSIPELRERLERTSLGGA
jgi:HAD superfamily hydrolase (TIGR01549 family)